ncbi:MULTISPECIES: hypothetical protein [Pseudomonas]|uniref:hypothetical protein n=1 Tax=Pseudomonas TaxID=286 RepID=UPI000B355440|nr:MULTISPECIES: hypothetical protein [Pseudomonas]PMY64825.1 hypothetical protein C1Y31_16260 [Pseudomonas sp. FW305-25]PMY69255.1 hypothetical protein C1Y32_16970 [Pseudomonas sp. FW126-L8]PNA80056.1 hypothetical protein C1Y33_12570 [Pseudomonas sp. FW305-76]
MSDTIIVNGDQLQFDPMFGNRQVTPVGPAIISGSGLASINQQKMCVVGDEKKVQIPAQYQIPGYSPGMGLLTIAALGSDQQAPRCTSGAALLLKGQQFIARFTPTQPAINSASGVPDVPAPSMGKGRFIPKQSFATAG